MPDIPEKKESESVSFFHAATLADQQLCDVSRSFDYLLQITPINASEAWRKFIDDKYLVEPNFIYRRPLCNLAELKNGLSRAAISDIKDTSLAHLFLEKRDELDRQINSLINIGTSKFLKGSVELFGAVESDLLQLANSLLSAVTFDSTDSFEKTEQEIVSGREMALLIQEEIVLYRSLYARFNASVELTDGIASGILVSNNKVLVSSTNNFRKSRVCALINHEIGTHLLTYINGQAQPFQQIYVGLAGYDCLQEGIAVLCEYLCGGLSLSRIRTLAARVVACDMLVKGSSFIETFDRLHTELNFGAKVAFYITLRVYRGGGTTKDAIYLRGLRDVLAYLGANSEFETLFIGKFSLHHIPYIEGLMQRGILKTAAVLPHFLSDPEVRKRLRDCRGQSVMNLLGNQ